MGPQSMAGANMGIGIIGSAISGIGQIDAGKQEQKAYDYNADVTMLNAGNEIQSVEQKYSQLVGKQATAYAASGVDITRGSPLLMMAATAGRGGKQAEEILQSATQEATLDRYYGKIAAWKGRMAGIGSFLSGLGKSATSYLNATGYTGDSGSGNFTGGSFDWGGNTNASISGVSN